MRRYNTKYDDADLAYQVRLRDAIRRRHTALAARYDQTSIAKRLGIHQAAVSMLLRGERPARALSAEQREWVIRTYNHCQYHKKRAQPHRSRKVCEDLGICMHTRIRILKDAQPEPIRHGVNRFLTMRL